MYAYYIYQADIYCEECGAAICDELDKKGVAPADPDDQYSYDSDDYPKECYDSGETDSPTHCANCLKYLRHSLTSDGVCYVLEKLKETLQTPREQRNTVYPCYSGTTYEGCRHVEITRDWADDLTNYGLDETARELVSRFLEETEE